MVNIFWGILATVGILAIVYAIIHFSSRKATAPTTDTTTSSGGLTDWAGWGKLQDNFAIPVALILILGACWLAWPEKFSQASANSGFWAGMILAILVGGILLRATVPFKDSWIRKMLLAGSLLAGIALVTGSFIPWDKLEALSQAQASASQKNTIVVQANPTTGIYINSIPSWAMEITTDYPGFKWIEWRYKFGGGLIIVRKMSDGQKFTVDNNGRKIGSAPASHPNRNFEVRAYPPGGEITISWR